MATRRPTEEEGKKESLLQSRTHTQLATATLSTQAEATEEAATPPQQFKVTVLAYTGVAHAAPSPEQASPT